MTAKKTIGITGGSGFIGSWIAKELLGGGYNVVLFDHVKKTPRIPLGGEVTLMLGDVRDPTAVTELAAHVDGIVHLSAVLGTQETIANPWPSAETNILGSANVFKAASQYGLPLVYAGVGNYWMNNTYSTTKTAAERLLSQYRDELGQKFATVRPVNAYGPGQAVAHPFGPAKVRKITPAFICRAIVGTPIEVYGSGNQVSDMVHVADVARVFRSTLEMLFANQVPEFPIEVGSENPRTVMQVAEQVSREALDRGYPHREIVNLPMRPGEKTSLDINENELESLYKLAESFSDAGKLVAKRKLRELGSNVFADTTTLNQVGINPESFITLEEGIRETFQYFEDSRGREWDH